MKFRFRRIVVAFVLCAPALLHPNVITAGAQISSSGGTQGSSDSLAFWRQVMADRKPISSIRDVPMAAAAMSLIVNDADATRAFNVIISRRYGRFSSSELKQIEEGLHFTEVADKLRALNAESEGASAQTKETFIQPFRQLFTYVFLSSPNWQATKQLWEDIGRFIPDRWFHERGPEQAGEICSLLNESRSFNSHCYAFDNTASAESEDAVGPDEITLAKISQYTYNIGKTGQLPSIDGYTLVYPSVSGVGGFAAYVFGKENVVVIAFRGTEPDIISEKIENYRADASWVIGAIFGNTKTFDVEMIQAINLVATVHSKYPTARIYLTGHSLGGAIAQILGARIGLPTATYNAPGAADRLSDIAQILEPLADIDFANKGNVVNYIMQGDHISLAGHQIGSICTVAQTEKVDWSTNSKAWLYNHSMDLMIRQLRNHNLPRYPGLVGPGQTFPIGLKCATLE